MYLAVYYDSQILREKCDMPRHILGTYIRLLWQISDRDLECV